MLVKIVETTGELMVVRGALGFVVGLTGLALLGQTKAGLPCVFNKLLVGADAPEY